MYVRGLLSVVRCCYRIHAIFMGQIDGVLELERHECGAFWSVDFFSDRHLGDALKKMIADGRVAGRPKSAAFVPF